MTRSTHALSSCVIALAMLFAARPAGQAMPIGIIDFYGLGNVSVERARSALTFKEGDAVNFAGDAPPAFIAESEARLAKLPAVQRARINLVCCDNGRAIAYVGLEQRGAVTQSFRTTPDGAARLPADVVKAGEDFSSAHVAAVQRGDAGEDRSRGHALNHDPATRAVQDRFVAYARRDPAALRQVLRTSSEPAHRALAAQVIAYAADKAAIVDDLVDAMNDPDQTVRNNALRALWVLGEMVPKPPPIPAAPFIVLLNSPVWSDRNKASGALEALTRRRDADLLEALRREAIAPLVEIARWKSEGHAQPGYFILARIANYADDRAFDLWKRGEREVVIRAAMSRK